MHVVMHGNLILLKISIVRGNKFYLFRMMHKDLYDCETITPTPHKYPALKIWNVLMS